MAYQGTADLAEMAYDLSCTIKCGNWNDAVDELKYLNGRQALYLVNEIVQNQYLSLGDLNRLTLIASKCMNIGEEGEGYMSKRDAELLNEE